MTDPLQRVLCASEPLALAGVPSGFLPWLAADLARAAHGASDGGRAVVIAADEAAMRALADTIPLFAPEVEVLTLPAWDCLPYDRASPALRVMAERLATLNALQARREGPQLLVATANAATQRMLTPFRVRQLTRRLAEGERIDREALIGQLNALGYQRSDTVADAGEYAVRGSLIDLFPAGETSALRFDFFGDEIESLRRFDPADQRSTDKVKGFTLMPASEALLDEATIKRFRSRYRETFGAGFALQLDRLCRRGADGLRIYRRRVLVLLGIGLAHEWLIWDGDILVLYALMGLVLPIFYRLPDRSLLAWSVILIFAVPMVGVAIVKAMGWPPDAGLMALSDRIAISLGATDTKDGVGWLRREDIGGWFAWIVSGPFYAWGLKVASWRIFKVLGIMVLGIWVGRRLAAGTLVEDRRLLWTVFVVGLLIGLPANLAYTVGDQWQTDWSSLIGTVPLALAYAAGFALVWPIARPVLEIFAYPGRMALTNYLAQSVISIVTFYGVFLGFIGRWPPPIFYAYALAVYTAQLLFSRWWLRHHAQGPMERLWRRWTYGNKQALTGGAAAV